MSGIRLWAVFRNRHRDLEEAAIFRLERRARDYRRVWDGDDSKWEVIPICVHIEAPTPATVKQEE